MNGFVDDLKQKKIGWILQFLLFIGLGTFVSLCLVSYGFILYIWQSTDPGCVCYSQRVFMSRGRFENMRQLFDATFYILTPLTSLALFKLSRLAPLWMRKPFFISIAIAVCSFLISRSIWSENIPSNYYLFVMAGKIMAYHYSQFANLVVQPMFTWSFILGLSVFLSIFVLISFTNRKVHHESLS